jgi:hypothetical protein
MSMGGGNLLEILELRLLSLCNFLHIIKAVRQCFHQADDILKIVAILGSFESLQ